ncbi:hypothetical protein AMTRI_Chr11g99490 [Amborella trichopoda]
MMLSWSFRMISHTGTETRPKLPRGAAVGKFDNDQKPDPAKSTSCIVPNSRNPNALGHQALSKDLN